MKTLLAAAVTALLVAATYVALRYEREPMVSPEAGYRYLYDGDSLAGWHAVGGEASFAADGESIVGRHGPGDNSFLRTDATFGNFSLKLQVRWDEPGNSGVMFRAQQRGGDGRTFGYQYELDPSERAWTGGVYDEARRGWLVSLEDNAEARAALRLDDWNDVEIEARGAYIRTWINGVPAAELVDGLDLSGFIALQVHAGNSGVVRWRRIRIKELGAAPPVRSLLDTAEWRPTALAAVAVGDTALTASFTQGDGWLASRQQFSDARLRFRLPACDDAATMQLRHQAGETGGAASFAEVTIHADRAEGRLVTPAGEQRVDAVALEPVDTHAITAVTRGQSVVLTVNERDVLRVDNSGLSERGQLRIRPARCGDAARIEQPEWVSLKDVSAEPLFYQTLDTPPAPVLTPDEALAAFRIAPGFDIELVAAEPLVQDPVAMDWDEFGRLYVVEMRGFMRDAYGTGGDAPVGQVVRLTDDDGDGRMDRSEVFLGALVNPRAVAVVNEGILIGEPPNLWLCKLPARDALCGERQRVGDYAIAAEGANVEHLENGLRAGLDNWLYNAKSARSLRFENGRLTEREGLFRGQWGIASDDYGRLFYNHNSTWLQADALPAEDVVAPGTLSGAVGATLNLTPKAEVFSVRVNPGVNRAYLDGILRPDGRLHLVTAVSGLAIYRGDQFPVQYRGDAFVAEPAANVVAQFGIAEEAAATTIAATQRRYDDPQWGQRDFLGSTDERFRPVDVLNGPDGALYIVDMYRGIVQDNHFLTDELREQIFARGLDVPLGHGRIWRLRHQDGATTQPVRLGAATDAELIAALSHANGWVRDTAQRLLLARGGDLRAPLSALATGPDTVPALHAVWTLAGRGELDRDAVLAVLASGDAPRQAQVLRAGRALLTQGDALALADTLREAPDVAAAQLALTLGRFAADDEVRAVLLQMLVARADSELLRLASLRAVRGEELRFLTELFAANAFAARTPAARVNLRTLAEAAYRSLRGDLTTSAPAPAALADLLALIHSRAGAQAWQQAALLKGIARVSGSDGFVPAQMSAAPPIFTDTTVGEQDPLWQARLDARAAFTWSGDELARGMTPLTPEQMRLTRLGEAFYPRCATCHGADGSGIEGLAPPLADASWVTGPPEWLGRIILQGMHGPMEAAGVHFDGVMPAHGQLAELDDATLAGLMIHLRRSFGNKSAPVSVEQATAIRAASAQRTQPWTADELRAVAFDRGYARFTGKYAVSFLTLTVREEADGLYISAPMYGGGRLEPVTGSTFKVSAGGESVRIEFVVADDGSVNQLILLRKGERIPIERKR